MPTGQNWINFIYVNLGFVAQVLVMYYFTALVEIKSNWPLYRCNPLYLPLSDNMMEDFTYCVQNTQVNLMGYIMQPFTYLISSLNAMGEKFAEDLNGIRSMLSAIRAFVRSTVEKIFAIFLNIVIEFQVIMIGIKDMMGKLMGIMSTLMFMMDGSIMTMQSAWKGPAGQMVQALACFHPQTLIRLKNGKIVCIQDIPLGSVLENGGKVFAVMKLDNSGEPLYKIKGGVDNEFIYVTGSHFIYDKGLNKFIKVSESGLATREEKIKVEWYSSLLTTDNKIQIGDHIFWDWEDDCLTNAQ